MIVHNLREKTGENTALVFITNGQNDQHACLQRRDRFTGYS
jgi:hypothetical protein